MKKRDIVTMAKVVIFLALLSVGIAISVIVFGCGCPRISRPNYTNYEINKRDAVRTPMGSYVILNGNIVGEDFLDTVDEKITKTVECLDDNFPKYRAGNVGRECFVIYIPNDWRYACQDSEQQIFGKISQEACAMKGFEENPDCPCGLRVAVQSGKYIVTTPNLFLFRSGVAEFLTGWSSNYQWENKKMIECIGF